MVGIVEALSTSIELEYVVISSVQKSRPGENLDSSLASPGHENVTVLKHSVIWLQAILPQQVRDDQAHLQPSEVLANTLPRASRHWLRSRQVVLAIRIYPSLRYELIRLMKVALVVGDVHD